MPYAPTSASGNATIAQIFQQKGLWQWFASKPTNYYNGQSEKGIDYSTTFGTPVAAPVGGVIVRIVHNNNSIGDVVELQDANGAVWLYQHITAKVKVGQTLGCGSVVGTENGMPIDQYSTGPHIEVRYCAPGKWSANTDSWYEPWSNPLSVFGNLAGQTAGTVGSGNAGGLVGTATALASKISLSPSADVASVLAALDVALAITNPFDIANPAQDTLSVAGASLSFSDPIAWFGDVTNNLFNDTSAIAVRLLLLGIGAMVLIKVSSAFIDYGALMQTAQSLGGLAAMA